MQLTEPRWNKYNRRKYNQYEEGKIKCPLCGGFYKKPCSHAVQKHDITSKEFKTLLGFSKNKGILCKNSLEIAKQRVFENRSIAIQKNLIEKGEPTRLKKGDKLRLGKPGLKTFNSQTI